MKDVAFYLILSVLGLGLWVLSQLVLLELMLWHKERRQIRKLQVESRAYLKWLKDQR